MKRNFVVAILVIMSLLSGDPLFDVLFAQGNMVWSQIGIDMNRWVVEGHSGDATFHPRGDTIEISTSKGLTLWYRPRLVGNYEISYSACMPMDGDVNDRLSDLNCFWAANDPQHPDNLFARSSYRNGVFQRYKTLTLFYVGYGGNHNSTTRFRQYYSGLPEQNDEEIRPVIKEYADSEHLLKSGKWYHIRIVVEKGMTYFYVNDELLFMHKIKSGDGNFGLRLLENHVLFAGFSVKRI